MLGLAAASAAAGDDTTRNGSVGQAGPGRGGVGRSRPDLVRWFSCWLGPSSSEKGREARALLAEGKRRDDEEEKGR